MKTFLQWLEDTEDMTGLYPPLYGGVGNYPASYFSRSNPYIAWSRKEHKKKKKKKKKH
jgi:hypothetical protein